MTTYNIQGLARAIFEEAGDALFLSDPDTDQLIDVNPTAQRLTGFSRPELLRMQATQLFRFGGQEGRQRMRRAAEATGVFHSQEGYYLRTREDNVWIPVNLTIARLHVKPKTLALMTARDIREQHDAHTQLKKVEAELRRVLASVSDCLWSAEIDAEGKWTYRYFSPVVEKIAGRPASFFLGGLHQWWLAVYSEDRPRYDKVLARLRAGQPTQEEYRVVWPDGTVRWVRDSVRASPAAGTEADRKSFRLDGVLTDITGRKLAEEALARERDLLRTLMDNLPDYIYVKDTQSRMLLSNTGHLKALGARSLDEVIGKTDFDFFPRAQAEPYYRDEQELFATGRPLFDREELVIDGEGRRRWVRTTKVPLRDRSEIGRAHV